MMDNYLKAMQPFDPNGSLSPEDADRIWASYKAAGGGRDVSASLPQGGGLPSGNGGQFTGAPKMDFSGFGSLINGAGGQGGGLLSAIQRLQGGGAAPAVPSDGAMQPTIGPGMAPPAASPYQPKMGLPPGGLLGILQGKSPQGLMGLLQHLTGPQAGAGAPLAGAMPQAGMLGAGTPGSPFAGPVNPQLPMDINPMNQF